MIETLTLNPMIGVHMAAVAQTVLVAMFIAVPNRHVPADPKKVNTYWFFRNFGSGTAGLFGILFLDIAIWWLAGAWTMTDWPFQLPSVLLLLFIGIQMVVVGLLSRGNLLDIIYLIAATALLEVFIHVVTPAGAVMGVVFETYFPVVIFGLVGAYVPVALLKVKMGLLPSGTGGAGEAGSSRFLWDVGEKLGRIFNRKVNVVAWVLVLAQSMLFFLGFSLFSLYHP